MKELQDYQNGKRSWLRLHEKGGKLHEVPAHHSAEHSLDAFLMAAAFAGDELSLDEIERIRLLQTLRDVPTFLLVGFAAICAPV